MLLLWLALPGCGQAPAEAAAKEATVVVGPCSSASFADGVETNVCSITGTLRGVLRAKLRRFADGKEEVLAETAFTAEDMAISGAIVIVLREAVAPGRVGERSVELRMPVRPLSSATSQGPRTPAASTASAPIAMPTTPLQMTTACTAGQLACPPRSEARAEIRQGWPVVMQVWSETRAPRGSSVACVTPWEAQAMLLHELCVDGAVTTVVTVEVDRAPQRVPPTQR